MTEQLSDIQQIQEFLPHRYPFLLVDRVLECTDDQLTAIKNVTYNEPFFTGHFPHQAIMPGVLILEALAQTTGLLSSNMELGKGVTYYLVAIDNARFKRPVTPGDQLTLIAKHVKHKRNIWSFECRAEVDGELAASANIMCSASESAS